MILILNICKEKLHEYEFINPIQNIIKNKKYTVRHYKNLEQKDIDNSTKIIISGTSLKDTKYLNHIKKFNFLKDYKNPILGICAGCQILVKLFGGETRKQKKIGQNYIEFREDFLGVENRIKIYELHNIGITKLENFKIYNKEKNPLAIKHKEKEIYATIFHPEVYNHEIIENFCEL